jgi:hypothetical protein
MQLKLLYDKWVLNKPIANCIQPNIFEFICNSDITNIEPYILSFDIGNEFGNKHNVWLSDIGIKKDLNKVQYGTTKDWVYPIEPWGHIIYSLNIEATDDYANFFDFIPKQIIKDVNLDKGKIIINYSHEGWVSNFLLKQMYLGAKNAGIKFKNIILVLNDYNLEDKLTKFKEKYNIEDYPNVINYSFYLTASSNHFYQNYKNTNLYIKHINAIKPYKFVCLNRRLDLHRVVLMSEILNEIKDESLISFDKTLITNEVSNLFIQRPDIQIKFNNLPNKVIADREDIENTNGYHHENEDLFLQSHVSIVTETSFYIDNDFISEKIWKPLYQFHPVIVVGRPHLLKYLREIGFKTFDWLIDETYDTIEDNDLRMEAIIKQIKKLNDISIYELDNIIKTNFNILKHNHDLLNAFGKQKQITEDYFIKNIKNNNYSYIDIYKELKLQLPTKTI